MAQETDSARWDLKVWAGTIDQLVRAAALAAGRVADTAPYPADYDRNDPTQRYDAEKEEILRVAERARRTQIVVVEDGGFNRALTAIADLSDIPDDHLGRVGVIDLEIGGNGYVPSSVKITVSRRDGLETRVCGRHRTWTAGLRHELQDLLRPSERVRPPGLMNSEVIGGVAIGAIFPLWLGFGLLFRYATDSVLGIRLGLSLAIALLLGGSVAFLAIRLPTMELLAGGQRPTYQRWRSRILAAAVALVIGIAGSLVAAAVAHENSHSVQKSGAGSQTKYQSH